MSIVKQDNIYTLPLISVRDNVILPGIFSTLFLTRERAINVIKSFKPSSNPKSLNVLFTLQNQDVVDFEAQDLYEVGTVARVVQVIIIADNKYKIVVEGIQRVQITKIKVTPKLVTAEYTEMPDDYIENLSSVNQHLLEAFKHFTSYVKSSKRVNEDILQSISPDHKNPGHVLNLMISYTNAKPEKKQALLEMTNIEKRVVALCELLLSEKALTDIEKVIQERVKRQMEKTQRDYYLNEQIKAIQKELGEDDKADIQDMENKLKNLNLPKEVREKAKSEIRKLKLMNPSTGESSVVRNYLDTLLSMPWGQVSKNNVSINSAIEILDRDHYGLYKVKDRIIEYLAVLERSKNTPGQILCFRGPPGVGKTSLAKSIAEALGRKFARFALGGIRDEAEIRGHRRTYLGSMPGKIVYFLKKLKEDNPVILLDEIDKMSFDNRGDPGSALLEVLDKEQNHSFVDNYLEVGYDISKVIFIATANTLNFARPLLDRMEVIEISGYSEQEKLNIATNYLVNKQMQENGLSQQEISVSQDALLEIIRYYTSESGVRNLERRLASLMRKVLRKILAGQESKIHITKEEIREYLGVPKYKISLAEKEDLIGNTTGLAYTEVGGELLSIEALTIPGKGEIKITGQLGEVMRESVQAAYSYFRSCANNFGVNNDDYKSKDIHIHVPAGAIPKDGPSAGIAIYTTIVSLMTSTPVKKTVAMTGEITLQGRVLPIGGLREKLLAAIRGGIEHVLIPSDNKPELDDIPNEIKDKIKISLVANANEVLSQALVKDIVQYKST